jgi:hypothetical protein
MKKLTRVVKRHLRVWFAASSTLLSVFRELVLNLELVEAKMCALPLESAHFIFNKCPFYTHDGTSVKFSTNSHETDYSVCFRPDYFFSAVCLDF